MVLRYVSDGEPDVVCDFYDALEDFFDGNETIQMILGFLRAKKARMCWKIKIVKDES